MKGYPLTDNDHYVLEVSQLDLSSSGYLQIPRPWTDHLKLPSGKFHYAAGVVLSETIYWYKPQLVSDAETGKEVLKKKFKADKWHIDYNQISEKWGISVRQVRDAVAYLKKHGLIELELRSVITEKGQRLGSVPYITPNVKKIREISQPAHVETSDGPPTHVKMGVGSGVTDSRENGRHIQRSLITEDHKRIPEPSAQAASEPSKKPEVKDKEPEGENGNGKANNPHQELLRLYQEALGYKIPNGGQEASAAKKILKYYSPQDAIACYRWLKSDAFWAEKHLSLQSVYKQMGPWSKIGKPTYKSGKNNVVMSKQTIEESDAYNDDAVIKGVKMRRNKGFSDEEIYEHMKSIGFPEHEIDYYLSQ